MTEIIAKTPKTFDEVKVKRRSMAADVWRRLRRNKLAVVGMIILILLVLSAVFAPLIAPQGPDDQDINRAFISPNLKYIFGTDNLGRDLFSRVLYGGRISLEIGIVATAISCVIGVILGSVAGFFGNTTDNIVMRILDMFMSIPQILLAIVISTVLGTGVVSAMIAVGISGVPAFARIVRGPVMQQRNQEYIEAAIATNASTARIIFRYVIPNVMAPIIVQITLGVAGAIIQAAGLSFLGLGVQPPTPEWGSLLSSGRQFITDYGYITFFPGLFIMLTVLSFNLFGDGLRDAIDPRLKN